MGARAGCCASQESGTAVHPDTLRLGQYSKSSGKNDSRNFWRFVDIPVATWLLLWTFGLFPEEIERIRVVVKHPKFDKNNPQLCFEDMKILHPHRVLSYLFNNVGIEIPLDRARAYWRHLRSVGEPWALASPASEEHIPLGIHGDGARLWTVSKYEKFVGVSLNLPLFRPSSTRYARFMVFVIDSAKFFKNRTMNEVWKRLTWSLNSCFEGINPTIGWDSQPLRGSDLERAGKPLTHQNLKFSLTEYRGDWEWHRDTWRPLASWISTDICFKCPCRAKGDPGYVYTNVGGTAADNCQWINEEFSLTSFINRRLKSNNLCNSEELN